MLSLLQFRYSNYLDIFLMIFGLLAAIVHGLAQIVVIIIFGDMIDDFVLTAYLPGEFGLMVLSSKFMIFVVVPSYCFCDVFNNVRMTNFASCL